MGNNGHTTYNTRRKRAEKMGYDPNKMTPEDWAEFYRKEKEKTKPDGSRNDATKNISMENEPVNGKPADTFNYDDLRNIIQGNQKREDLKKDVETEPIDPGSIKYADLRTNEEKTEQKTEQEKTEEQKKADREKELEEKIKKQFGGLNGGNLIWALEVYRMKKIPELAIKRGRVPPTPEQIVYTDLEKDLMRPGADEMMIKLLMMVKNPIMLCVATILFKDIMLISMQPKINKDQNNEQYNSEYRNDGQWEES